MIVFDVFVDILGYVGGFAGLVYLCECGLRVVRVLRGLPKSRDVEAIERLIDNLAERLARAMDSQTTRLESATIGLGGELHGLNHRMEQIAQAIEDLRRRENRGN